MDRSKEFNEEISLVAYLLYERRGTHGFELEDWFEAERIVMERIMGQEPAKKTSTARAASGPKKKPGRPRKVKKPEMED
ncbi:MAG: DUF2934 domain-containing protein [Proteobacteria bacterium]|nr:DUF2934 domain-containing protein [Pseudomonadota bacterium]